MRILCTCHWCHVLARESFEDKEVAENLNSHFISIKVDKEERPDIDQIYMNVCQMFTGSGGWPLSIFMTNEQKPFYAGTYFPRRSRYGQPGFLDLLQAIQEQWKKNKNGLMEKGEEITRLASQEQQTGAGEDELSDRYVHTAYETMKQSFDSVHGGFGTAPKFPMPHNLLFLLQLYHYTKKQYALEMAEKTLQQMYKGGIFDHLGYGFSRYSTDAIWLAPHFEKMLYDNALLLAAYLAGWKVTDHSFYKTAAEQVIQYLLTEMRDMDGGFYSSQDADSEGEEGKYYTFTKVELLDLLGPENGEAFCSYFGVTEKGNFEHKNILNRLFGNAGELSEELRQQVYDYRKNRYHLHKDDKILCTWNGLTIAAFAMAGRMIGKCEYIDAARTAYEFINKKMRNKEGRLNISYRKGSAKGNGLLDDYASYIWACLELYEGTFQVDYLKDAIATAKLVIELFAGENGGFYLNAKDGEKLLYRPMERYDGAVPSGNSVIAYCFVKLAALTGAQYWQDQAENQLRFFQSAFKQQPQAYTFALTALLHERMPSGRLICIVPTRQELEKTALELGRHYHPEVVTIGITSENAKELGELIALIKDYEIRDGKPAFYLCYGEKCLPPADSAEACIQLIEQIPKRI